ncbi:aspartate racemase [Pyrenophora seminiperda CCB06]|uniref:Aspartate racemase n=1 Tax=Pyrenophora seminiperda CCB06 TaxID=1302712 RepID=A0A3M7MGL2_9PLEO|nr:aspartate racemase [Pyrenophora seminiperda CCB06]
MSTAEVFSALGLPARTAARVLLSPRYVFNGFLQLRAWKGNTYARARYGPSFIWRTWLLFDCRDLEVMEKILNYGSDEDVLRMREAKLEQFKLVALVGALLATLALQALSMPLLGETTFIARSSFTVSTTLSLLATFFTCIQQRELGVIYKASAFRLWLSNGIRYTNAENRVVLQSSLASLTLLEAPYELISLAVANFVAGMAAYMWGVYKQRLQLQMESGWAERVAAVVYFAFGTGFAFAMFPVLLGSKDRETQAADAVMAEEERMDLEMGGEAARREAMDMIRWEAKVDAEYRSDAEYRRDYEYRGRRSC